MIEATIKDIMGFHQKKRYGKLIGCRVSFSYLEKRKHIKDTYFGEIVDVVRVPKHSRLKKEAYRGISLIAVVVEDIEADEFGED